MFQAKCECLHITDIFFNNKNRLVLVLSDTCSYIDRLGRSTALDLETTLSRRERNSILSPSLLQSLIQLRVRFAPSSDRIFFRSRKHTFVTCRRCMYFQRTLKAALILSCINQHCDKTRTIIICHM